MFHHSVLNYQLNERLAQSRFFRGGSSERFFCCNPGLHCQNPDDIITTIIAVGNFDLRNDDHTQYVKRKRSFVMDVLAMLLGIQLKANPTKDQKLILSQWMGCSRLIWNSKCDEERYYSTFARKYYPIGTYAPMDQTTSQFKNKLLTPWLYDCPSQILRNSASNWYQTYQQFIKGSCGKPRRKPKSDVGSIHSSII
jgi:hypothetical protein